MGSLVYRRRISLRHAVAIWKTAEEQHYYLSKDMRYVVYDIVVSSHTVIMNEHVAIDLREQLMTTFAENLTGNCRLNI